jgi:hypothetical protein
MRTRLQYKNQKLGAEWSRYLTTGIGYLRSHLKECLICLEYRRNVIVENNGKPIAVLVDYNHYNRMLKQRQLFLRDQIYRDDYMAIEEDETL